LSHHFLSDPAFHAFLLAADRDLAEQVRGRGCQYCGAALHAAHYERRPAGAPETRALRLSFCCAADGCRKRETPGSLRFLGRKVYLGAIVVLASILYHGLTPARRDRLEDRLGVSERTLVRWRRWWLREFARSRFWQAGRRRFPVPVLTDDLPGSLLARFSGEDERGQLIGMLRFLVPITGGRGLAAQVL
jgi:hypothetical protein